MLLVGGTNHNDTRMGVSNYEVPSDSMVFAPGYGILTADCVTDDCNSTSTITGTSLAAPTVAGVAALMLVKNPDMTPRAIRDTLYNTGEDVTIRIFPSIAYGRRINANDALTATPSGKPVAAAVPLTAGLLRAYPNPFNPTTTLEYMIPHGEPTDGRICIFNTAGQSVRTLKLGVLRPGAGRVVWDGCDSSGRLVASGTYVATALYGESAAASVKLRLIK